MKSKLLYAHGKPVKFARYGGLSSVRQKGYKVNAESVHGPPARKGLYLFLWPYIDLFLLSNRDCSGVDTTYPKFEYVKDKNGNRITDKHPSFEKLSSSNKNWLEPCKGDTTEKYVLVRPKHPKVVEYFGELWHHLGEHLKPEQIIKTKDSWVLSTYVDYVFALKKEFHNMAREPFLGSRARWQESNNPTRWWSKDLLEVFIERI